MRSQGGGKPSPYTLRNSVTRRRVSSSALSFWHFAAASQGRHLKVTMAFSGALVLKSLHAELERTRQRESGRMSWQSLY
jgi:hypothetical protein